MPPDPSRGSLPFGAGKLQQPRVIPQGCLSGIQKTETRAGSPPFAGSVGKGGFRAEGTGVSRCRAPWMSVLPALVRSGRVRSDGFLSSVGLLHLE